MRSHPTAQVLAVLAVTTTAILLGSQSDLRMLCGLLALAALATFLFPGAQPWGKKATLILGSLIALCFASYLPADWFHLPRWRTAVVNDAGLQLAKTLTVQPWHTATNTIFMVGAFVWLSYLVTLRWNSLQQRLLIHGFMVMLTVLALLAITLERANIPWPWGEHADQFSPFANRNQLATLCAMSLVLHASSLMASLSSKHRWNLFYLVPGFIIALGSLITIGSRAGLLLGMFALLLPIGASAYRNRGPKTIALAISLGLLGLSALFLSNTRLQRRLTADPSAIWQDLQNGRLAVYQDTLSQSKELPFFGHGLGNFPQVFPFYRDLSINEYSFRHPESDWLWWWSELGWAIPIIAILGIASLLRQPPKLKRHHDERRYDHALRLGLYGAALVFVLHSLIDVPAHRLGTLWSGLLVFSLLIPRSSAVHSVSQRSWALPFTAVAAFALAFFSPLKQEEQLPLAWQTHYARAVSMLESGSSTTDALTAFQRARFLEPHSPKVPLAEAEAWLDHAYSGFAMAAWREAMRRAPDKANTYYDRFLKRAQQEPSFSWDSLLTLAGHDTDRLKNYQALRPHQANR